ncbi:MAG: hypothetical protein Q9201_005965 [Fulgogasparrea decipioides]
MWSPGSMMLSSSNKNTQAAVPEQRRKLRAACDRCHQAKTKCSGGEPCNSCSSSDEHCHYTAITRTGRPKGSKNKRTQAQMDDKQQAEGDCSQNRGSPIESQSGISRLQPPASRRITPLGQLNLEQGLADFNNLLFDAASGDELGTTSYALTSDTFGDLLGYATGQSLQGSMSVDPDSSSPFLPQFALNDTLGHGSSPSTGSNGAPSSSQSEPPATQSNDNFSGPQCAATSLSSLPANRSGQLELGASGKTCSCLEQHTELLRNFKNLARGRSALCIDAVLNGVQQALVPWQNLIHCRICPHEDDESVLLLSLMSVRTVLRYLQQICVQNPHSWIGSPTEEHLPQACSIFKPGNYRPTQSEQKHITDLLIVHALRKINSTVQSLKAKFARSADQRGGGNTNALNGGHGSQTLAADLKMDVECIQPVFENLDRTLHAVINAVRNRSSTALLDGGDM